MFTISIKIMFKIFWNVPFLRKNESKGQKDFHLETMVMIKIWERLRCRATCSWRGFSQLTQPKMAQIFFMNHYLYDVLGHKEAVETDEP